MLTARRGFAESGSNGALRWELNRVPQVIGQRTLGRRGDGGRDVDWNGIARAAVEEATAAEPDVSVPVTTEVVNARRTCWSRRARTPISSWWVAADTAGCCSGCSGPSMTTAPITPTARWLSSLCLPRLPRAPDPDLTLA